MDGTLFVDTRPLQGRHPGVGPLLGVDGTLFVDTKAATGTPSG